MGYAHYSVARRGEEIEAGYGVEDVCNQEECPAEIDRGLGYLCGRTPGGDEYGCGGYFCGSHLLSALVDDVPQLCPACLARWEQQRLEELTDLVAEAVGGRAEVKTADVEDGKPRVLVELADGFEAWITVSR
jgi:hypothetical protein